MNNRADISKRDTKLQKIIRKYPYYGRRTERTRDGLDRIFMEEYLMQTRFQTVG